MSQFVLLYSVRMALLIEIHNSAMLARNTLTHFLMASVGARNLKMAKKHSIKVSTMVLILICDFFEDQVRIYPMFTGYRSRWKVQL